jgi:hypothetical protein
VAKVIRGLALPCNQQKTSHTSNQNNQSSNKPKKRTIRKGSDSQISIVSKTYTKALK